MAVRKILLDTSVIIDFLRRKDKENSLLISILSETLYISIITHTELNAGKSVWEKEYARKGLEDLLSGITIIPLNDEISKKAGFIKAYHSKIDLIDSIIASTAIVNNLELATLNLKDFKTIKDLKFYNLS